MPADASMFPCRKFAAPEMFGTWPNILGSFTRTERQAFAGATGCFTKDGETTEFYVKEQGQGYDRVNMNASLSNSAYMGTILQPKALQTLACIRF